MIEILRIINIILWSYIVLYMAPAAYSALRGKAMRRGDPMRLAVLLTSVLIVAFNARWFLAPTSDAIWMALYVLNAADAVLMLVLASAYGRGPATGDD